MAAALPRVSLRLLGPVQIEQNGDPVEKLGSQKSLILLAYLIRHPHEHSRVKLATMLWSDQPQSTARRNLRWALNNLSKLAPGLIDATRQTLHFAPNHSPSLDLDEFETLASPPSATDSYSTESHLSDGHLAKWAQAVARYRGDFLEGFAIDDAPDLELWLLQEREYWRRRVVTLLERLIAGHTAQHQYYHAERFATQLLMHEPWREETHQQLMWLLAVTGQRSAALAQYDTCRQILAGELAVEPTPVTVALYEQIRDNQPIREEFTTTDGSDGGLHHRSLSGGHRHGHYGTESGPILSWPTGAPHTSPANNAAPGKWQETISSQLSADRFATPGSRAVVIPHNLPRERTPLVGRRRELTELHQRLVDEARPLVTLIGEGGVGKSRLALALAEQLVNGEQAGSGKIESGRANAASFRNGIWFVPLVGIDEQQSIATALITAIAAAIHLQFAGVQSPFQQLVDFLRHKESLLLLDNMEHLVDGALLLSDILAEAPGVQMLVTSRVPLDLQEEWRFSIQGMALPEPSTDVPSPHKLRELQQNSSVALFVQTGQRVDHQFALTVENQRAVVAICRHLHGLPLALELAATGLVQMSCQELANALIQPGASSMGQKSTAARNAETSLDLLQTTMRNMPARHRAMRNVFAYSWRLLTTTEQQAAMQFALFRGSADRGALMAITGKAPLTLTALVHKSLVQRDSDGRFAMHELLRQFCLEQLVAANEPLTVTHTRQRHAIYYMQTLHEAEATIKGHDPQPLLTQLRRDLDNIRQAWQWAIHSSHWALIDQSLSGLTRYYLLLGLLSEGRQTMREAATLLRTALTASLPTAAANGGEATAGVAGADALAITLLQRVLSAAAFFANALADYDAAITVAQEVIALEGATTNTEVAATAHLRWGEALWYKGEIEVAQPHLTQALALVNVQRTIADLAQQEVEADALCVLGLIAVRMGNYAEATAAYAESHRLSDLLGDAYRTGRALYSLGTVYRNQARYAEAQRYLAQGLAIARQTGDRHSESRVLNSLGDIELYQGNFRKARDYYTHVAQFATIVGDRRSECIAQTNLGIVARDLGQFAVALQEFNASLTLARTIGFPRGEGWTLCCLSLLHHQRGHQREALRLAHEALTLFDQLGDRLGQAFAQTNLGRAYQGMRSWQEAQRAFTAAKMLRQALGQPHLAVEVTAGLALAAWGCGEPRKGLRYVEEILAYLQGATLEGSEVPNAIYQICYQILDALNDERASTVWADAQRFQQTRVERLENDEKRAYLASINQFADLLQGWM